MPFDWTALVELAKTLRSQAITAANSEAYQRSAVGRAYFGAFGYAVDYATQFLEYDQRQNRDDHGRLRDHLRKKKRRGAADRLGQLRQWRNDADYLNELPWQDTKEIVDSAIDQALEVFEHLPPPRPK